MLGIRKGTRRPASRKTGRPRSRAATGAPRTSARSRGWRSHAPDALGLAVLFSAILMVFSLADSAGPAGLWMGWFLRLLYGRIAYLVPVGTVVVAIAAFVRREETTRIVVGTMLVTTALAGIVHLATGTAPLSGGYDGLALGGGVIGAMAAVPLRTYIGGWAGALACVFTGILGALIITKTPLRRAVQTAWLMAWAVVRSLLSMFGGALVRTKLVERTHDAVERESEPELELEPDDDEDEDAYGLTVELPGAKVATRSAPIADAHSAERSRAELRLPATGEYVLPPLTIFRKGGGTRSSARGADEVSRVLERTLHDFGVDASVTAITRGPTVTRFEVELGAGVKVSRVLRLADDMAYALGSPDVRLIAPIPGKSAIGVEVPNRDRELVLVGDVVHTSAWSSAPHPLTCALGKDISGQPVVVNLAEMPHLLIAGATGAGKSSCLNALIASLLTRARPEEVRMVLIDPKMVELSHFNDLPHLLSPVVTHPKRAAESLAWIVREMERRYELLSKAGQRNIDFYNEALRSGDIPPVSEGQAHETLPYMAVFIDELADLMMVAARQVEDSICRIAQMARAVGIHLVVATQRPSVDVVTGLIKANIPSRIAFAVASQTDSRVVLDMGGADKLVGHGDMLYLPTGTSKPRRVQGAYVSEAELEELTTFIRAQAQPVYEEEVFDPLASEDDEDDTDGDPLLSEAMELVIRSQMGSTSMLQRKLRVGFSRAGRLMDLLERKGVVAPQEGSKARRVLISLEDFEEMQSRASGAQPD